jgi:hypothetical protein
VKQALCRFAVFGAEALLFPGDGVFEIKSVAVPLEDEPLFHEHRFGSHREPTRLLRVSV